MADLNQSRNSAFQKLLSFTESNAFTDVRKSIINGGFYQRDYLSAEKFRSLADELDLNLVWRSEYTHFLRIGWLTPCYFRTDESALEFGQPKKKNVSEALLVASYFHPYRILQVANCTTKSEQIRSMLVMLWRGIKNRRNHLKQTKQIDEHLFGSYDPTWMKALTDFAIVLEPIYRPQIRRLLTLHGRLDFEGFYQEVEKIKQFLLKETEAFNSEDWEEIHNYAAFISSNLDKNYELKTLITVMRSEDQDGIKGKLGASLLAREVAQLIRYIASDQNIELEEEQFCEGPIYTPNYFSIFRGSKSIVDGPRENRLKFVRGFGLDFTISVRLYVEGDTEKYCLMKALGDFGYVEIVDLKGAVWQRGGKGLSFKESLHNDKRSNIYSVLVFDSDQQDLVRIVREAAKNEDFLGQFYLSQPDFELQNFSVPELLQVVKNISGILINPQDLSSVTSAKEFFSRLNVLDSRLNRISKGQRWGQALWEFALKNAKTDSPGLLEDRYINQIVRFCHFTTKMNFAGFASDHKVDTQTGRMVDRK